MSNTPISNKQERAAASSSKKQLLQERRRQRQRRQRLTAFAIIGAVVLMAVLILAAPSIVSALTPVGNIVQITPEVRPLAQANAMGDPNAPVKIIEYSDYQCPYCARFLTDGTEMKIVETYVKTGKVYFVFRTFGQWIGPESVAAGQAAYCAGDQNKFWEYHDYLFYNQTGENVGDFTEKRLIAFADELDLDLGKFKQCLNSNKYLEQVQQDQVDGKAAGVTGTPAFVINGELLTGAQPFERFAEAIEAALATAQP